MPVPTLIAHRGYASRYPENTLLAMRAAVDAGACWLELDVQLNADAVPVLLHDATLQRTAGRADSIFEFTTRQLQPIRVGEPARFGDRFADTPLPTLAEFADWLADTPTVQVCVEIKVESLLQFGVERVYAAVWSVLEPLRDRCVLISYDDAFLFAARTAAPIRIGWVLPDWNATLQRRAHALAPDLLITNWKRLPPAEEPLWPGAWQWAAYEVTDVEQALELTARGITFVETMAIGELLLDPRLQSGHP